MNGFPESQTAERFAGRRLPGAGRRREVPDRLRPAAAAHDVRRQGADGAQRGADAARGSTGSTPTRTTPSCSTSATSRGHPGRVRAVLRAHRWRCRPTRTCSTTRTATLWEIGVLREDEVELAVAALLAAPGPEATAPSTLRSIRRSTASASSTRRCRTGSATCSPASSASTRSCRRSSPFTDRTARARLPLRARARLPAPRPGLRAARPRQRGRAHAPEARADLRGLRLARPQAAARSSRSSPARAGSTSPSTAHLSQIVDVINERFGLELDDDRPAPLRPVRGELGRR